MNVDFPQLDGPIAAVIALGSVALCLPTPGAGAAAPTAYCGPSVYGLTMFAPMAAEDRSRKPTRLTAFSQLGEAFAAKRAGDLLARARAGDLTALAAVARSGLSGLAAQDRQLLAGHAYNAAKVALAEKRFADAEEHLARAHALVPGNPLLAERVRLIRDAVRLTEATAWRLSLHELQRELGVMCLASHCRCTTHYEVARCQGLTEPGFQQRAVVQGIVIHTVAPYRPYSHDGKWTNVLWRVKHEPYDLRPLKPMADILSDFIFDATPLLRDVDVIVPVPASAAKYVLRGFAPNNLVGRRLGQRLALPFHDVLARRDGVETLEATYGELAGQFILDEKRAEQLRGLSVLLVEDIWTQGRTIPICAAKLRACGPANVSAVALGRTRR